jgi:signal transduction histidine kinase
MLNSLKFKIAAVAFTLVSIILTATTWRDIQDTERQYLDNQKEKTELLSDRISHGIMVLMLNNRWKDLQNMMESLVKNSEELREIRVFRPANGNIVVSSEPEDVGKMIYEEDRTRFINNNFSSFIIEKKGQKFASKLTPIKNQAACVKCHGSENKILGVLDIEISLAKVTQSIKKLKKEHLIDAFIAFSLITGAFMFVVGFLIDRPIRKMIRTLRNIEDGKLSERMDADKNDEFGILAKSFNHMLESLKSAQEEIEHSHLEQMQKASRLASLGEIISGIAHEVKNPLTGISCAVQVLQSDFDESDSRKVVTSEILNQINRLDKIVKDLLSFAKPKPPQFMRAKINDVMEKALFFVYPEAKKQKIAVDTDIEMDFPEMRMDPDQIQQVFLNLMINALQATPPGGSFGISIKMKNLEEIRQKIDNPMDSNQAPTESWEEIQAARVRIDALRLTLEKLAPRKYGPLLIDEKAGSNKMLEIRFQDSGKGISPIDIESIFKPFFTKKTKGTGLGLFISQKIIQEHGGDITVRSEVGKGSVFTVYLPVTFIQNTGDEQT